MFRIGKKDRGGANYAACLEVKANTKSQRQKQSNASQHENP